MTAHLQAVLASLAHRDRVAGMTVATRCAQMSAEDSCVSEGAGR
jgi:hypothetical protein